MDGLQVQEAGLAINIDNNDVSLDTSSKSNIVITHVCTSSLFTHAYRLFSAVASRFSWRTVVWLFDISLASKLLKMSGKSKAFTKEEELLLQDFSRNVSTKSSALFYGNAFIVSAIPICECRDF